MSSPRTPSKRSLARVPSMGSSFASCFGASLPISPRRTGGHSLLGGQVSVNYRKLGFDEDEDEEVCSAYGEDEAEAEERHEHASEFRREGPFLRQGKQHLTWREEAKNGMQYVSEGEQKQDRGRRAAKKLGSQSATREKARMDAYNTSDRPVAEEASASEQEEEKHGRERKGIQKLAKLWSVREREGNGYVTGGAQKQEKHEGEDQIEEEEGEGVYGRERRKGMTLGKIWVMRERGTERRRRESLSRKVREACVQVIESARRSSPHLSELFVGNQLLMQVTSSSLNGRRAQNVVPSTGFHVAGDPPLYGSSPPRSSVSS